MNQEMDIEGWEFLSDDGFLDHRHHEDGEGKIVAEKRNSDPESVFNMNYFKIESPKSSGKPRVLHNQLVPVPFQLEPPTVYKATDDADDIDELFQGISKVPIDFTLVPPPSIPKKIQDSPDLVGSTEAEQDAVSQVFFKKTNNNEFVDMKMDSPRSGSRGISPTFDAGAFSFEDTIGEPLENKSSPRKRSGRKDQIFWEDDSGNWEDNSGGVNLWKWSLTGIGAICSFGVAAATIGIFIFASQQKNKNQQKLSFQIYTDDKRIKQVVQQATKLNEAISVARGVPITRAHITFGGYYDSV